MCYPDRNRSREDEARGLREEDSRGDHERYIRPLRHEEPEQKPPTEKVKEMVRTR